MIYSSQQQGFTLVEVLVAITILLLVTVGPMKILSTSSHSTAFASEQVNAFFLAQEGLELAEKGRDDWMLKYYQNQNYSGGVTNPWTRFQTAFSACINGSCDLTINNDAAATITVTPCSGTSCLLYLDTNGSRRSAYFHTATPTAAQVPTLYTRSIIMKPILSGGKVKEVLVTSTVTWRTGTLVAGQSVTLSTYLENVYDTN